MFSVVEMQPKMWWQTGQSHVSEQTIPNVGGLHLSVQYFPKYPVGQSQKKKKTNDKKGIEKEVSLDVYEWFSGTLDKIKHTSANITIFVAIV